MSGEVRRVSHQDIQLVQNLIERCLQLYMNQKEVVQTLLVQAKIEPGFTELVWQKLEEENREFFKAYHVRLLVKDQIVVFNKLLEKQVELMQKIRPSGVASMPLSNGSNSSPLQQNASCYMGGLSSTSSIAEDMLCNGNPLSAAIRGRASAHQNIQAGNDASIHSGRADISPNMLSTQNSNMGVAQGMNGMATIKSEPSYSSNSEFAFCMDGSFPDAHSIGDAPVASFSSLELNGQSLNDSLLEVDTSSIGFLSQIPRNFSFSNLTDDFTQCADILENYGRSPFLPEVNDFAESPETENKGENQRLDTISEGVSYEDFASD